MRPFVFALFALLLQLGPAAAATVIHAGHLIAEPGRPPLKDQSIVIENGRITAVRDGFVGGDRVIDLTKAWVMPGLIDMHTHITFLSEGESERGSDLMVDYIGRPSAHVLAVIPLARALLARGFTTIRNLGDPASVTYDLRDAIDAGVIDGPRIIGVEPQFGVPGGDYEAFRFGAREDLEPLFKSRGTCSGAEDCARAVRAEVRRGAGVIKFRLSGADVLTPNGGLMETPEEVRAVIETAHRLGLKVAVHSPGTYAGAALVIEAGADTIEHGPLDDADIAAMVRHGTAYTPTLMAAKAVEPLLARLGRPDAYARAADSVRRARAAGVPILFGSDLPVVPRAGTSGEFLLLRDAGLTPAEALAAATVLAARYLGRADLLGTIAVGKAADVIAVPGDPLQDLGEMAKVGFVMKGGKVIRDDFGRP